MPNNSKTVLVRVDANQAMGIGHAMRCLALSERLKLHGFHVVFAAHQLPDLLRIRLEAAQIEVTQISKPDNNIAGLRRILAETPAQALIFDGYHLGNEYEKAFSADGYKTLRFDDYMPDGQCHADIVVNASPHADAALYQKWAPRARLLLGTRFIAFRSDMIAGYESRLAPECKTQPALAADRIMINFGGSDPLDLTIETVDAIAKALPDVPIDAVTGAAYPHPERLSSLRITNFQHHHNTDNLPQIMQCARLAISAGGLTVQELALFRIPTILAITAENQIKSAHVTWCHTLKFDWKAQGLSTNNLVKAIVGEAVMLWQSPKERAQIISRIPKELDLLGTERIVEALIA